MTSKRSPVAAAAAPAGGVGAAAAGGAGDVAADGAGATVVLLLADAGAFGDAVAAGLREAVSDGASAGGLAGRSMNRTAAATSTTAAAITTYLSTGDVGAGSRGALEGANGITAG
jgi:hypothetical protein